MICLVSEQSLPNYLGIKKYMPDHLHLLHSDENRFVYIMNNLSHQSVLLKKQMIITAHPVKPHDVAGVQDQSLEVIRELRERALRQKDSGEHPGFPSQSRHHETGR